MRIHRRAVAVDGLPTSYLEAGDGDPVVLLHGGEFGANAEIAWEHRAPALLISRLVSWVDDLWCRAIGAGV